jgi:hypothetical protein
MPMENRRLHFSDGSAQVVSPYALLSRELTDEEIDRVQSLMSQHVGRGGVDSTPSLTARIKDDAVCPRCGYLASDHTIIGSATIVRGVKTMEEMRALSIEESALTWDMLACPLSLSKRLDRSRDE